MRFFISHASEDLPKALRLKQDLSFRGHELWLDELELTPGDRLRDKIIAGIDWCDVILMCLSRTSICSSWVKLEFYLGCSQNKRIIPIRIQDCILPDFLTQILAIDMRTSTEWTTGLNEIERKLHSDTSQRITLPISPIEWDIVMERSGIEKDRGKKLFEKYKRLTDHIPTSEHLADLIEAFKDLLDSGDQKFLDFFEQYILIYPAIYFEKYKTWYRFAADRRITVGNDPHVFAMRMTAVPIEPKQLISIFWNFYKKTGNEDVAWTWTLAHKLGGLSDEF